MNLAATGPKLLLAPAADPGDGLLDLVYLEPEARDDDAGLARRLRRQARRRW